MGQKYCVKMKKVQVQFKNFKTTLQIFVTVSQGMWTKSVFFQTDCTRQLRKSFDRNAGRVPVTLQLPQPDSQKVFKCLEQISFCTADSNSFIWGYAQDTVQTSHQGLSLGLFFTVMLCQSIVSCFILFKPVSATRLKNNPYK